MDVVLIGVLIVSLVVLKGEKQPVELQILSQPVTAWLLR